MLRVISEIRPAWVIGENVAGIVNMALDQVCTDLENEGYEVQPFIIPACGVDAPHRRNRVFIVAYRDRNSSDARRPKPKGQQRETGSTKGSYDVADTNGNVCGNGKHEVNTAKAGEHALGKFDGCGENVADTERQRLERYHEYSSEFNREDKGVQSGAKGSSGYIMGNPASAGLQDGTIKTLERSEQIEELKRSDWWSTEPLLGRVANGVPARVDRLKCLGNAVVPQQAYPIFEAIAQIERRLPH
jgi:DNA (cytosine-5)-methyltransferase 1